MSKMCVFNKVSGYNSFIVHTFLHHSKRVQKKNSSPSHAKDSHRQKYLPSTPFLEDHGERQRARSLDLKGVTSAPSDSKALLDLFGDFFFWG